MLNSENIILLNPYNKKHIEMLEKYEEEYNPISKISDEIKKIANNKSINEYINEEKKSNEIKKCVMQEKKGKILNYLVIHGEKDRKIANIFFSRTNKQNKKFIEIGLNYTLTTFGLEELFVVVSKNDRQLIQLLEKQNLENLGEESGSIIFLKENEKKYISRMAR